MNNSFLKNLFRAGLALLLLCALSISVQAQTISTQGTATPNAFLNDDLSITLKTYQQDVPETFTASVSMYAYNMPDQATADTFMDQFEREFATIEVDQPSLTMTLTLEMNAETSDWTVHDWNEHLKSN